MVAQRRAMRVGSRVSKGKENVQSEKLRRPDENFLRRIELGLSIIRQKIKLRVDRCQELLEKLDKDSRQMKICFLQLMEVFENSRKVINNEKEENIQLLQLLDGAYTGKTDMSSRIQTVNPMIDGVPMKKASISLKRLDPFQELQSLNNSRGILADFLPASDIGFSQPSSTSSLHQNIHPHQIHSQSEEQVVADSSDTALPRHRGRCRRWHEVRTPVPPASCQEFHLKRASIHLKRLDPRSYLPERDIEEVLISQKMPFENREVESVVLESMYRTDTLQNPTECEDTGSRHLECVGNGKRCVKCPSQSDPMVILERLEPLTCPVDCDANNSNTAPHSCSGVHNVTENCQRHYVAGNTCEESASYVFNSETKKQDAQQSLCESENSILSTQKKRKIQESSSGKTKSNFLNNRINTERRVKKTDGHCIDEVKKRKSSATKKKNVEFQLPTSNTSAVHSEKKADEDPLEGPSWLYKDGVLKKAKLRKLKKIREDYLKPFYYLAPTIYSSTDESGDELNDKEKKNNKLRKRKQKKRN